MLCVYLLNHWSVSHDKVFFLLFCNLVHPIYPELPSEEGGSGYSTTQLPTPRATVVLPTPEQPQTSERLPLATQARTTQSATTEPATTAPPPTTLPPTTVPALPCHAQPCKNAGTCLETGEDSYRCACAYGWGGKHCTQGEIFPFRHFAFLSSSFAAFDFCQKSLWKAEVLECERADCSRIHPSWADVTHSRFGCFKVIIICMTGRIINWHEWSHWSSEH